MERRIVLQKRKKVMAEITAITKKKLFGTIGFNYNDSGVTDNLTEDLYQKILMLDLYNQVLIDVDGAKRNVHIEIANMSNGACAN